MLLSLRLLPFSFLVLTAGVVSLLGQQPAPGANMSSNGAWTIRSIAFSVGRQTVTKDSRVEVFVSDNQHKKARRVAEGFDPDWSPDGSQIVFAAIGDRGGMSEIYTANSDGSVKKQLTQKKGGTAASSPAWSPDGKRIAFTIRRSDPHSVGIYVMGEDGSSVQFVTEGLSPHWSPDGQRLVFYRHSETHPDKCSIWVANTDGSEAKQITDEKSRSWFPRWTTDGKIVFASDRDGRSAIYLTSPDGSNLKRLLYSKDFDFISAAVSPDSKQLVAVAAQLVQFSGQQAFAKPTIVVIELDSSHQTRWIVEGEQPSVVWSQN